MGRKGVTNLGVEHWGMRQINVSFQEGGVHFSLKTLLIATTTELLVSAKFFERKWDVNHATPRP